MLLFSSVNAQRRPVRRIVRRAPTRRSPPRSSSGIPSCGNSCCRIKSALRNAGFDERTANLLTGTAWFESSWGAANVGRRNSDGSVDYGMLQANSFLACSVSGSNRDCCCPGTYPACKRNPSMRRCSCTCGVSCATLTNSIEASARCARRIFTSGCGGLK